MAQLPKGWHYGHMTLRLLLISWLLSATQVVYAGEFVVLDQLGLARAVKSGITVATVTVTTIDATVQSGTLSNVDGLKSDLTGRRQEDDRRVTFIFERVSPGTWQFKSLPADAPIEAVNIRVK